MKGTVSLKYVAWLKFHEHVFLFDALNWIRKCRVGKFLIFLLFHVIIVLESSPFLILQSSLRRNLWRLWGSSLSNMLVAQEHISALTKESLLLLSRYMKLLIHFAMFWAMFLHRRASTYIMNSFYYLLQHLIFQMTVTKIASWLSISFYLMLEGRATMLLSVICWSDNFTQNQVMFGWDAVRVKSRVSGQHGDLLCSFNFWCRDWSAKGWIRSVLDTPGVCWCDQFKISQMVSGQGDGAWKSSQFYLIGWFWPTDRNPIWPIWSV